MRQIILTDEQARILSNAVDEVELRDQSGNVLGYVPPAFTAADIARAKSALASNQPRYTTEQVLSYLRGLKTN